MGQDLMKGTLMVLEPGFIKHYAPNSLPLTVKSHHVLFQRSITPEKYDDFFKTFNQVIYSSSPISWASLKPLAQIVSKLTCWQV